MVPMKPGDFALDVAVSATKNSGSMAAESGVKWLHMSQFPKFAYDRMRSPAKEAYSRHKNNAITKRRIMSKMDCERMDIDPSVFGNVLNGIQWNPNFLEVVGNVDCRTVSADPFES